jgi:hypothetical protein
MNKDHGFLKIDRSGRTLVFGQELRRTLSHQLGYYTLKTTQQDTLEFQRVHEVPRHGELREPMIFQGDIGGIGSTIEVINFVKETKLSGQLTCVQGEVRKSLYFKEGVLCAARSNLIEDRLGEVLYRFGAFERDFIEHAENEAKDLQRPIATHLLETGALNQEQLYLYFKRQVEEIFFSILLFIHGDFYFTIPHLSDLPSPLNLNVQQLLLEGVRRKDEMRRFKQFIPSREVGIIKVKETSSPIAEELQAILDELEVSQSVKYLMNRFRVGEFRLYQRLFQLLENGLIQVEYDDQQNSQKVTLPQLVQLFNDAFTQIEHFAQEHQHESPLTQGLSTFLQFYGFTDLFHQVDFDEQGLLNTSQFLDNVENLGKKDPLFFVGQALSELLFFQIFISRPWLDLEQHNTLQIIFNELTQLIAD